MTIDRIEPGAWNARAVVHGGLAHLSGIVARDKSAAVGVEMTRGTEVEIMPVRAVGDFRGVAA